MLNTDIFGIVIWTIIIVISLSMIILIVTASIQEGEKYIISRTRHWNKKRRKNKIREIEERNIKAAPTHLYMLTQPEYIIHLESFILLLDKIDWPVYPESSINADEVEIPVSRDELEDYEEELEEAIEEEDNLYNLYIDYLQSNNYKISQSELSYVVDLYKNKLKIN